MLTLGLYGVPDPRGDHAAHDHAIALMRDGTVLASMELERATGRKHDNRLDRHFDDLVRPWLVPGESIRLVQANSFLGSTFATRSGSLRVSAPSVVPLEARLVPSEVRVEGALTDLRIEAYTVSHELAHIGTCLPFCGSFPEGSLLVHVDGGASVSACSAWHWDGSELRLLESSWEALKAPVNNFNDNPLSAQILGLDLGRHLEMPGKLMGLASLGSPRPEVMCWLLENGFFLGKEWREADLLREAERKFGRPREADPTRAPLHWDIAACMQRHLEDEVLGYVRGLKVTSRARHLFYSGGAALNVHANTRIERECGFESVTIPPAPSDCGLALGAAAMAEWLTSGRVEVHDAYLTRLHPEESVELPSEEGRVREFAARLAGEEVVAAVHGLSEVGPRALGHRSLLARPDRVPLRRKLSECMKRREWYRPVAPLMSPEVAASCLEGYTKGSSLGRFMLGAWKVKPEWRSAFAGSIHADGTVRAQVIDPAAPGHAPLTELLAVLEEEHGVFGLINTSLNTQGTAILHSPARAAEQAKLLGATALWTA